MLGDSEPSVQAHCAYALAWFPENAEGELGSLQPLYQLVNNPSALQFVVAAAVLTVSLPERGVTRICPSTKSNHHNVVFKLQDILTTSTASMIRWATAKALLDLDADNSDAIWIIAAISRGDCHYSGDWTRIVPYGDDILGHTEAALWHYGRRNGPNWGSASTLAF